MASTFENSGTMKAPLQMREGHDGRMYKAGIAHTTLTVNVAYAIHNSATGPVTAAIADNAAPQWIGVCERSVTAGTLAWLVVGGEYTSLTTPSLSVTAGHYLGVAGGAIIDEAAATPTERSFAVNTATTTSATTHNVILLGREITAST